MDVFFPVPLISFNMSLSGAEWDIKDVLSMVDVER